MKKSFSILLLSVILILICVTGCENGKTDLSLIPEPEGESTTDPEEITAEKECEHIFKESVYKEPMHGVNGIKIIACVNCNFYELGEIPSLPDVFELRVNDKDSFVYEDPNTKIKECVVVFDLDITNISDDKTIKYISGNLIITGINGIFNLQCEFSDISITPGETKNIDTIGFSFDYASLPTDIKRRVYDAEFDDLKFLFEPTKVSVDN